MDSVDESNNNSDQNKIIATATKTTNTGATPTKATNKK